MRHFDVLQAELVNIRLELEELKNTVKQRSFLPVFYRRSIVVALIFCGLSLIFSCISTIKILSMDFAVNNIYSQLISWGLIDSYEE